MGWRVRGRVLRAVVMGGGLVSREFRWPMNAVGRVLPVVVIHGWLGDHRYMAADLGPVFAQADGWSGPT